jgi:hypothetical protein
LADIFISHQHGDRDRARLLAESLERLGFSVWWDFKMRAGEAFRDSIEAMLRASKVVIVLWTPRAVQSRFVRSEASKAQRMGKLAPAMFEETELPLGLDEMHAIDLTRWDGEISDQNFQVLLRDLEVRIGRPAILSARGARDACKRDRRQPAPQAVQPTPRRQAPAWRMAALGALLALGAVAGYQKLIVDDVAPREAKIASLIERGAAEAAPEIPIGVPATPPSQAALLAAVENLPFDGRRAYGQARRAFEARDREGPFGLATLHPVVRRSVRDALRAAARADASAARARAAVLRAEDAARLAEAGAPGTIIEDVRGRHWATEWAEEAHNGFGALAYPDGDRFAGAWRDGRFEGPGVFTFEGADDRAAGLLRYEGDFAAGRRSGPGIMFRRDGERYAGAFADGAPEGAGVFVYANGERYEGEWRAGQREGPGVLWSAGGEALQAGLWRDDRLASPLAAGS